MLFAPRGRSERASLPLTLGFHLGLLEIEGVPHVAEAGVAELLGLAVGEAGVVLQQHRVVGVLLGRDQRFQRGLLVTLPELDPGVDRGEESRGLALGAAALGAVELVVLMMTLTKSSRKLNTKSGMMKTMTLVTTSLNLVIMLLGTMNQFTMRLKISVVNCS